MKYAESTCYVREEVYQLLIQAAQKLPVGYRFRILDAWRPFTLQEELYDLYSKQIIEDFKLEQYPSDEAKMIIKKYISEPIPNQSLAPVHTTGGAIDLTIIDKSGNELDMGTPFDSFSLKSYTAYFEDTTNPLVRENRRLLYHTMTQVGFTNLPSEWWHYDYGDHFWGYYQKKPAIYKGIFTRKELYEKKGE